MSLNDFGDGLNIVPDWINSDVAEIIYRAKKDMPRGFQITTIEKQHGLVLWVDRNHFETFTLEDKIIIATRINQLKDEIERTGCPTWVDIEKEQ